MTGVQQEEVVENDLTEIISGDLFITEISQCGARSTETGACRQRHGLSLSVATNLSSGFEFSSVALKGLPLASAWPLARVDGHVEFLEFPRISLVWYCLQLWASPREHVAHLVPSTPATVLRSGIQSYLAVSDHANKWSLSLNFTITNNRQSR
ncbi:hypothetical protein BJV77DRAFT_681843 [Russula vinacea]|nr:hypothetical protein BJV77DRAFT_681843 [Russula vinacea]